MAFSSIKRIRILGRQKLRSLLNRGKLILHEIIAPGRVYNSYTIAFAECGLDTHFDLGAMHSWVDLVCIIHAPQIAIVCFVVLNPCKKEGGYLLSEMMNSVAQYVLFYG